jgi:Mlc titration factor MtfA (ptsG expression regulator)
LNLLHPLRDIHRNALLAHPMSDDHVAIIEANVAQYALLTPAEQSRLRDDARLFVLEKDWEGAGGLEIDDEIRYTIAAQACLLLIGWDDARRADLFPNVRTVIVYPSGFRRKREHSEGFLRTMDPIGLLGESWSSDLPVVISWDSARDGAANAQDGHNVILHEFAHKLDSNDGSADGVPLLADDAAFDNWAEVMSSEFEALTHDAERGHKTLLDTYGATNPAEFFAVATEAFFEKSVRMQEDKPRLYSALQDYYRQDPAARFARAADSESEPVTAVS